MPYLVKWSSQGLEGIPGKANIPLADRTYNSAASTLTLTGKGLSNYGLFQQENFLRLLENFASNTAPVNPTVGQIWYNYSEKNTYIYTGTSSSIVTVNGWTLMVPASAQSGGGLAEYNMLANILNRIVGAPAYVVGSTSIATADSAFGWGQTDLVPVYADVNNLTAASIAAQATLPSGSTFPTTFSNAAWTILLSRVRKALRQVYIPGIGEGDTSPIGFLLGSEGATPYGNILNNLNAGPTPYRGKVPNYTSGWQGFGQAGVSALLANTLAQINALKANPARFTLATTSAISTKIGTASRISPAKSLTIPSPQGKYTLRSTMQFPSLARMLAFFNSGGQIRLDFAFIPTSSTPSNVETDWRRFLARLNGLVYDYQGTKWGGIYVPPRDSQSSYLTMGFYGGVANNAVSQETFIRSVLSTLNAQNVYGLFSDVPPTDGGVIINSQVNTSTFQVIIDIDFYLRHVINGDADENDTTDTSLTGELKVDVWSTRASSANVNSPVTADPSYVASGTFITAA